MIRMGFGGPFCYNYSKEPPTKQNKKNNCNYLGPYVRGKASGFRSLELGFVCQPACHGDPTEAL